MTITARDIEILATALAKKTSQPFEAAHNALSRHVRMLLAHNGSPPPVSTSPQRSIKPLTPARIIAAIDALALDVPLYDHLPMTRQLCDLSDDLSNRRPKPFRDDATAL
jgi:hypothetical protein